MAEQDTLEAVTNQAIRNSVDSYRAQLKESAKMLLVLQSGKRILMVDQTMENRQPIEPWQQLPFDRFLLFSVVRISPQPDSGRQQIVISGACVRCDQEMRFPLDLLDSGELPGLFHTFNCTCCQVELHVKTEDLAGSLKIYDRSRT